MSDWSMTVEAGASLGGLASSGARSSGAGPSEAPGMVATVRRAGRAEPESLGPVAVEGPATPDSLADALAALAALGGGEGEPARLVIVTDPDADGRTFDDLDEAAALAGLPAPTWLPAPVALAGGPLAERLAPGDRAVVLDTRDGDLTAWPVERTPRGLAVGAAGPVAVAERVDELITGVVRATGAAREGADPDSATGPIDTGVDTGPVTVGEGAIRRESARLRREVRRVRRSLAEDEVEEVTVSSGGVGGVVDRALFTQLVTVALSESMITLVGDAGVAVEVVAAGPTPLARTLAELTGAVAETVRGSHAAVLGAAALLGPVAPGRGGGASVTDDSPTDDLPRTALAAAAAGVGASTAGSAASGDAAADAVASSTPPVTPPATPPAAPAEAAAIPAGATDASDRDADEASSTPGPRDTDGASREESPAAVTPAAATPAAATPAAATPAAATPAAATPAAAPAESVAGRATPPETTDGETTSPSGPAPGTPAIEGAAGNPTAGPGAATSVPASSAVPSIAGDSSGASSADHPEPVTPDPVPAGTSALSVEPASPPATAAGSSASSASSTSSTSSASSAAPAAEPDPHRSARPRWAVPALAVSLVVAIVGALGVILLGPDSTTGRAGAAPAPLVVELAGPTTGLPAGVVAPPGLSR